MRFGLALSGGSLRGVAHIGVLKGLNELGFYPSWISGTSAGSIIAALYAYGYRPEEIEEIALSIHKNIFDTDYYGIVSGILRLILTRDTKWDGLIKGRNIELLMKKLTKGCSVKEVKIPLAITSVDINTGSTVVFVSNMRGCNSTKKVKYVDDVSIYEAVRASISIPVVFKPKIMMGMRLVDGGVTDNVPVDVLKSMGAGAVIGINLGYSGQRRYEVDNIFEIGSQAIDIMSYQITSMKTKKVDCIINPQIYDVGMSELHRIPEIIKRGYDAVMENMDMIKRTINS